MAPSRLFRRRFTKIGAPPGALHVHEDAVAPRVHAIRYHAQHHEESDPQSAAEMHALLADGALTWVDIQGLRDHALIESIGRAFGLHRLCVADIVNVGQRPKCEDYGDYLYAVVRMVTLDQAGAVHWEQLSIVAGERYVLTFQERHGDCLEALRHRIRSGSAGVRGAGADYLAAQVIDSVVDGYFPALEAYGERLDDLEGAVLADPHKIVLSRIYAVRRELVQFRRAAWPLRDTLSQLLRDRHRLIKDATLPYVRDTADHVMQVVDVLENYRELAGSLIEVYLSAVSHRTNEVMRVLTVIATIFIPLTFLAGVYGMNFDTRQPTNMPELHWRYGYVAFWAVCAAVTGGLLIAFQRFGWLSRRKDDLAE